MDYEQVRELLKKTKTKKEVMKEAERCIQAYHTNGLEAIIRDLLTQRLEFSELNKLIKGAVWLFCDCKLICNLMTKIESNNQYQIMEQIILDSNYFDLIEYYFINTDNANVKLAIDILKRENCAERLYDLALDKPEYITEIEDAFFYLPKSQDYEKILYKFAQNIKEADLEQIIDIYIQEQWTNRFYELAQIPGCNINKLMAALIELGKGYKLTKFLSIKSVDANTVISALTDLNDGENLVRCAKYDRVDKNDILDRLLKIGDSESLCWFAREFLHDIDPRITEKLLETADAESLVKYALIKGADIRLIEDKLIEIRDPFALWEFVQKIKSADVKRIEATLLNINRDDIRKRYMKDNNIENINDLTDHDNWLITTDFAEFAKILHNFIDDIPGVNVNLIAGRMAAIIDDTKDDPTLVKAYFDDYRGTYTDIVDELISQFLDTHNTEEILSQIGIVQLDILSRINSLDDKIILIKEIVKENMRIISTHREDTFDTFISVNLLNDLYNAYRDIFAIAEKSDNTEDFGNNSIFKLIKGN